VTLTATDGATPADDEFKVGADATATATNLAAAITDATYATDSFEATAADGVLTITKYDSEGDQVNAAVGDIVYADVGSGGGEFTKASVEPENELSSLQDQYNALLTQLTELAEDSGYKGKNLLSATEALRSMTVQFEGTDLEVVGFDGTASGLGVTDVTWTAGGSIEDDLALLDDAMDTLSSQSAKLSSNLSIITVRQDFTDNMINVLTQGSDDLTLADTNEEGANMLMLQTRQSLSSTALSLSAQAAQSVLRLFG